MDGINNEYNRWLLKTVDNKELQSELKDVKNDLHAINDRFYRDLEFGTGGLRGVLGAGTNRMNIYIVAKATQGYSNYLKEHCENPSIAIAYDSRIHSDLFAETAASVFAANGIQVHIYSKLMPTPALSFAVRDLHCDGGIVITASHNPAKYNGYKVYGADGCQITTEAAKAIQKEIDKVDPFEGVIWANYEDALRRGMVRYIGEDTSERYITAVSEVSVLPKDTSRNVSIVYTPLNGAGISCVPNCLNRNGFDNITIPDEQRSPDGNFPTCPYPNPEIREALTVGLQWAEKTGSELLLATDPDCDRVGTAVRNREGGYTLITGNEMGVMLLDFVCKMHIAKGTMPQKPVAIKTIVTTPMAERLAKHYGLEMRDTLTGFKFIGEQIGLLEKSGEASRFIFGFEESYGYLSGSFVRDKDAVNASLLICEMFAYYKSQGKSLLDVLDELFRTYGYYESRLLSFAFEGAEGFGRMQNLLSALRNDPPKEFADLSVLKIKDYKLGIDGLPASDVLRYFLRDRCEVVVRPSGTEPKLKMYLTAIGKDRKECINTAGKLVDAINAMVNK